MRENPLHSGENNHRLSLMNKRVFSWCLGAFSFLLLVMLCHPSQVNAATYTWNGGGSDNNWSTCDNWGGTCPTATDSVIFDSTSTKDTVIDTDFGGTIAAVAINAGYTGELTAEEGIIVTGAFSQADGAVDFAAITGIDIGGAFTLSGGNFTASSQVMQFRNNFTQSGGVFDGNGGTTNFTFRNATFYCTNDTNFNLITFNNLDGQSQIKVESAACVIPLGEDPVLDREGILLKGATLTGSGQFTISGTTGTLAIQNGADLVGFTGIEVFGLNIKSSFDASDMEYITITGGISLDTGGTLIAPPLITHYGDDLFAFGGSFNANGGTFRFVYDGLAQDIMAPFGLTFYNLIIEDDRPNPFIIFGTINVTGTFTAEGAASDSLMTLTGLDANTWNINVTGTSRLRNLQVNNSISTGPTLYSTGQGSGTTNWVFDNDGPTTPNVSALHSPSNQTQPTLNWTTSQDTGSGLANPTYTIQWCQDATFSGCSSQSATTNNAQYTLSSALSDGTWYFRVYATDSVDNISNYSTQSILIDTQLPHDPYLVSPGGFSKDGTQPTLVFRKTTDAQTAITHYQVRLDTDKQSYFSDNLPANTGRSASYTEWLNNSQMKVEYFNEDNSDSTKHEIRVYFKGLDTEPLREGSYSWSVTAIDEAGNEKRVSSGFAIDQTPPTLVETAFHRNLLEPTSVSLISLSQLQRMPTFSGRVLDEIHGHSDNNQVSSKPTAINLVLWKWDTQTKAYQTYMSKKFLLGEITNTPQNSQVRYFFQVPYPLLDGTYKGALYAHDTAGNQSALQYFLIKVNQSRVSTQALQSSATVLPLK